MVPLVVLGTSTSTPIKEASSTTTSGTKSYGKIKLSISPSFVTIFFLLKIRSSNG